MFNYRIVLQFDGTDYFGWQIQKKGLPTIQGEITRAVELIAKKHTLVTGSSRTDAGVHAAGLVANFHLPFAIESLSLQRALNCLLPRDIRVINCQQVPLNFNARFHALSKTYQYRIFSGQVVSPFICRYVAHIPYPLDLKAIRRSLRYFKGEHDFSSFTSDEPEKKKIRCLDLIEMRVRGEEIIFTLQAKSFLRYMVRNIVGTLIDIGKKKILPEDLENIFAARDRRAAGQTAPAQGLTLLRVEYPPLETTVSTPPSFANESEEQ